MSRRFPQLGIDLIAYAAQRKRDRLLEAIVDGDRESARKAFGVLFRAKTRADWRWCQRMLMERPGEVLSLSGYIGNVAMPYGPMPGKLGWPAWAKALATIETFSDLPPTWARDELERTDHERAGNAASGVEERIEAAEAGPDFVRGAARTKKRGGNRGHNEDQKKGRAASKPAGVSNDSEGSERLFV